MESIWSKTCEIGENDCLKDNIETEVAVIGAGITGILTAFELQEAGKEVVVLETRRIASGQTCNTTAKITSQHGLIYHELIEKFGKEKAAQYARANQRAIEEYRHIIKERGIDCDFEEKCSYVYSQNSERLRLEERAATALKLPAELVKEIPVAIPCCGAIKFEHQAQFNPLKFIKAISDCLTIYENTWACAVDGNLIYTNRGKVIAKQIIFATHYPFINFPGLYFMRMHQERSYVLALEHAPQVDGMFIGDGEGSYSFRNYGKLLLFGGENHRTGENSAGGRYDALRAKAKELFPGCREVSCWSAQDCMTVDGVPYIGRYARGKPWYVATGFNKWGMTSSMAAAMILRDMICGRKNSCAAVFRPSRFAAGNIVSIAKESAHAVKGLSRQVLRNPSETAKHIKRGHGGIVTMDGKKVGVYKDEEGRIYAVDTRCPHLGCQLEWNPDELSWDCPCHGSRFDYHGRLLCDPAQTDTTIKNYEKD